MDTTEIIKFLKDNPRSLASEIGATPVEMNRLAKIGKVVKVGERKTGQRGRPPVEYAIPGEDAPLPEPIKIDRSYRDGLRLDDEQIRILDYIDDQLDSNRREDDDVTMFAARKAEIVRIANRRATSHDFDTEEA